MHLNRLHTNNYLNPKRNNSQIHRFSDPTIEFIRKHRKTTAFSLLYAHASITNHLQTINTSLPLFSYRKYIFTFPQTFETSPTKKKIHATRSITLKLNARTPIVPKVSLVGYERLIKTKYTVIVLL